MNEEQVGAAAQSEPAKRIIGGDPNKFLLGKCSKKVRIVISILNSK